MASLTAWASLPYPPMPFLQAPVQLGPIGPAGTPWPFLSSLSSSLMLLCPNSSNLWVKRVPGTQGHRVQPVVGLWATSSFQGLFLPMVFLCALSTADNVLITPAQPGPFFFLF